MLDDVNVSYSSFLRISLRRTETVAAVSSRRGIVTALIGARRAFPIRKEQCMRSLLSQRRRYATEP